LPERILSVTDKVHGRLRETAERMNVKMEALGNVLLMLSLCDDARVNLAANLIRSWDLGGVASLERRGL